MGWFHRHALLWLPVVATSAVISAYTIAGVRPSGQNTMLFELCLVLGLILWIEADALRRGILPCHDFGFLVGIFFPLSVVWYAFWSRGRKGVILLLAMLGLWVVPTVTAMLAWFVVYRLR
jgi:hypothetical protein